MSRRTFDDVDDTWTVGYDRPLHTFYAQVEPRVDLADDPAQQAAFTHRHPTPAVVDPDDLLLTVAGLDVQLERQHPDAPRSLDAPEVYPTARAADRSQVQELVPRSVGPKGPTG